jgi:hypothetical protein
MKVLPTGEVKVSGLEIIDASDALYAVHEKGIEEGEYDEPSDLGTFAMISLRVAAARGRARNEWALTVTDTEPLYEGLGYVAEATSARLEEGDLNRKARRGMQRRLDRVTAAREQLATVLGKDE